MADTPWLLLSVIVSMAVPSASLPAGARLASAAIAVPLASDRASAYDSAVFKSTTFRMDFLS
ncbi:hypothetical protein [Sphingobium scionense]